MIPLDKVEHITNDVAKKIIKLGYDNTDKFIKKAMQPEDRARIADESGVDLEEVTEIAYISDLNRIKGIGREYADLLVKGLRLLTVPQLARENAKDLLSKITKLNEKEKRVRSLPKLEDVKGWIKQAKGLDQMLFFENGGFLPASLMTSLGFLTGSTKVAGATKKELEVETKEVNMTENEYEDTDDSVLDKIEDKLDSVEDKVEDMAENTLEAGAGFLDALLKWIIPLLALLLLGLLALFGWQKFKGAKLAAPDLKEITANVKEVKDNVVEEAKDAKDGVVNLKDAAIEEGKELADKIELPSLKIGSFNLDSTKTIFSNLRNVDSLSTLLGVLNSTNLDKELNKTGPFTLLAPLNSGFEKINKADLTNLLKEENKAELTNVLKMHVLPKSVDLSTAKNGETFKTLEGSTLKITKKGKDIMVNGVKIVDSNVKVSNGTIYTLDGVIMPAKKVVTKEVEATPVKEEVKVVETKTKNYEGYGNNCQVYLNYLQCTIDKKQPRVNSVEEVVSIWNATYPNKQVLETTCGESNTRILNNDATINPVAACKGMIK